jgi:H+-transporting ATPase
VKWNLKALFFISTIMACIITLASLLLLWCCLDSYSHNSVFHAFGLPHIELGKTIMASYLQLTVSGFLTLFSARTGPKPFWSTLPGTVLTAGAVFSLVVSTVIACAWQPGKLDGRAIQGLAAGGDYHIWAIWVWLYAIVVFFIQDAAKARPSPAALGEKKKPTTA